MKNFTLEQMKRFATDVDACNQIAPVYICPICDKRHGTRQDLARCLRSTEMPLAKPGDIVCIEQGYRWHDGEEPWFIDGNGFEFHGEKTFRFWFVITAITQSPSRYSPHKLAYHVKTRAIFNGTPDGLAGWTTSEGRVPWKTPDQIGIQPPTSVVEQAQQFIGQTFTYLL